MRSGIRFLFYCCCCCASPLLLRVLALLPHSPSLPSSLSAPSEGHTTVSCPSALRTNPCDVAPSSLREHNQNEEACVLRCGAARRVAFPPLGRRSSPLFNAPIFIRWCAGCIAQHNTIRKHGTAAIWLRNCKQLRLDRHQRNLVRLFSLGLLGQLLENGK